MNSSTPIWQTQAPKKPASPKYPNDSILEALRDLGGGVGKTVAKDLVGKVGSDVLGSLFGAPTNPQSGELRPNQSIDFSRETQPAPQPALRSEILNRPRAVMGEPNLQNEIAAVRAELQALAASLKTFNSEVVKAISTHSTEEGIYHLNFMNRLKVMLRHLRESIDDSNTWLQLSSSRKKQKGYWHSYKKHGTQFGLSSERTMATQAG